MAQRSFQVRPAVEVGTLIAEYDNGGPYRRRRPIIGGPRIDGLARNLLRHMFEEVEPPVAQVVRFENATVRGPGVITLPDNIIVAESLINSASLDPIGELTRTGPATYARSAGFKPGVPVPPGRYVLLKQYLDFNYGHWIIESLPRMGLLEDVPGIAECRFVVSSIAGMGAASAPMAAVMTESLGFFGIDPGRVMPSGWGPQFFEELIYPLPLTVHAWTKAPIVIAMLEGLGRRVQAGCAGPERLFLMRPNSSRRLLRGQEDIAARLARVGYVAVLPSALSFAEQVRVFSGARFVIGTLGAECANLVFAPRGVRFLGLAPAEMQDDFFYDLVSQKDGDYFCLHGVSEGDGNAAFSVDPEGLEGMLEEMEG